jgi:hypothetical protein
MLTLDAILILLATLISIAGYLPYISGIIKGKSKPNRATWLIWSILGTVLCFTSFEVSNHDWMVICVPIVYMVGPTMVALLSFWYGEGGTSKFDVICFLFAFIGLGLWLILDMVVLALWLSIIIDGIGALPTIKKSYLDPKSESMIGWIAFSVANAINFAVLFHRFDGTESVHTLVYPLYLFSISVIILMVMLKPNKIKTLFSNSDVFSKDST